MKAYFTLGPRHRTRRLFRDVSFFVDPIRFRPQAKRFRVPVAFGTANHSALSLLSRPGAADPAGQRPARPQPAPPRSSM